MTRFPILLSAALLMAPVSASADQHFLCTGLGLDERQEAEVYPHNLRLIYSTLDGHYLGAVGIEVARGGEVIVSTDCDGPWLLMQVEPGTYTVTSTYLGETKRTKVRVGRGVRRVEKTILF